VSIRRTFLLLVVPLFLLLAGVNGALLYLWEKSEAEHGLQDQALAAAVTTAAFAEATPDLAQALAAPERAGAMRASAANITGLDGLYLAGPGQAPRRIAGDGRRARPGVYSRPTAPTSLPITRAANGRPVATALAPIGGGGGYVIAQIDAQPLFAQIAELKRLIAGVVAVAGLLGLVLAWVVAQRITGELKHNSELIEAIRTDAAPPSVDGLAIRETRDLANAVSLMRTSVAGRMARGERELADRDRQRDEAGSVAAWREAAFAPLSATAAGAAVAARMLGRTPAGAFYALAQKDGRAALVLGECEGDTPAAALARAVAARRYFERHMLDGAPEAAAAAGQEAFALTRVAWQAWDAAPATPAVLALLDKGSEERAAAYVRRAGPIGSAALADDLAALLAANGVLAVVGPP